VRIDQNNNRRGKSMTPSIRFALLLAGMLLGRSAPALASNADHPLNKPALVTDFYEAGGTPCGSHEQTGEHDAGFWHFKKGSTKFALNQTGKNRYRAQLNIDGDPEFETLTFYVINRDESGTDADPCGKHDELSRHVFLAAIHDLPDPANEGAKSPHALIYIPFHNSNPEAGGPYQFHLLVFNVVNDRGKCGDADSLATNRCKALRDITVDALDHVPEDTFIVHIQNAIDKILPPNGTPQVDPPDPRGPQVSNSRFHNGVIHGSL
jgi:hypothetical protein